MNLYLISQDVNDDYDTFDSCVVCADTEDEARLTHPDKKKWNGECEEMWNPWCAAKNVQVEIIGVAANNLQKGVVLASYNAG